MSYIAVKPVRFDRSYSIGEEIPVGVVSPTRAAALVTMGFIKGDVPVVDTLDTVGIPVGIPNGNPELELELGKDRLGKDKEKNSASDEDAVPVSETYDKTSLSKLKKDELVAIAEKLIGQEIDANNETKNSLIDLIIAAQEMVAE